MKNYTLELISGQTADFTISLNGTALTTAEFEDLFFTNGGSAEFTPDTTASAVTVWDSSSMTGKSISTTEAVTADAAYEGEWGAGTGTTNTFTSFAEARGVTMTKHQISDLMEKIKDSGPTVVQSSGTSTTDVMSQNAVTSMVFADPGAKNRVQIGNGASAYYASHIAIGKNAVANSGEAALAIGVGPSARGSNSVAVGRMASTASGASGSIAMGSGANATVQGQVDFGTSGGDTFATMWGYNNSNYRLLTGLYDPQSAHDAATKNYVDTSVGAIGAGTKKATTSGWNTSEPLPYATVVVGSPDQYTSYVSGSIFPYTEDLADIKYYLGIGADFTEAASGGARPYFLSASISDDGSGRLTSPSATRLPLYYDLEKRILSGGTTAPTTSTKGEVGTLYAYVENGTGHLAICTAVSGSTYTWQTLI